MGNRKIILLIRAGDGKWEGPYEGIESKMKETLLEKYVGLLDVGLEDLNFVSGTCQVLTHRELEQNRNCI